MQFQTLLALSALSLVQAQNVPPPPPVLLNSTKSGVLPVLPTPFNGTLTLQGAIISKAAANASYTPVAGPAVVQSNQPAATYVATLPAVPFNGLTGSVIRGTIMASANAGGSGVTFTFNLTGFPAISQYGPFPYHIHDMMVPSDGNCTSTLGHFDPTNAGEYYRCAASLGFPQNCQAGDLAGKHGMINATSFSTSYVDPYLSLDPASPYFFGAKSITFHTSNTTRLTCANFMMAGAGNMSTSSTATSTSTATATTSRPATFTGAANKAVIGSASVGIAFLIGLMLQ